MSAVQERLRKLFEIDWKKEAELVLAERIQTKKGEVSNDAASKRYCNSANYIYFWLSYSAIHHLVSAHLHDIYFRHEFFSYV